MNKQEYIDKHVFQAKLFKKYDKYISKSNIGLDVPVSWNHVVEMIFEYCEKNKYPIKIIQMKEKFGQFRCYFNEADIYNEEHTREIDRIAGLADNICIVCGAPATTHSSGWYTKRCEEHKNHAYTKEHEWFSDAMTARDAVK